jgi:hypothetical protein
MPQLVEGLKLLNQADPSVEISLTETGEHILSAIGELHLERCMKDLRERFAKIAIQQSDPIVPFRETIASGKKKKKKKLSIVCFLISELHSLFHCLTFFLFFFFPLDLIETKIVENKETLSYVTLFTPDKMVKLSVKAIPLPQEVTELLETNNKPGGPLRAIFDRQDIEDLAERKRLHFFSFTSMTSFLFFLFFFFFPVTIPLFCFLRLSEKTDAVSESQNSNVLSFLTKLHEAFENAGSKWKGTLKKYIFFFSSSSSSSSSSLRPVYVCWLTFS